MNTDTGRATDQAIAKIKELISSGEFSAGDRLPTERELTRQFGVSRSSLREAMRALALVGVLESRVGNGTYVTALSPELLLTGIGFVSDLARADSLLEMHQVRRLLEPEATRIATSRLTEDDLGRLEECLHRMETADSEPAFIEADTAFHRVILEACGNATLSSLIQNLSSGTMRARMWQSIVARGAVEATLASHRSIYNALVVRDADTAAAADLMHLAIAEEWLRKVLGQSPEATELPPVTN
jgi:GntR family transcriptional regulator, transcriptional repressor for pyruvate dehydrogenase complex